MLFNCPSDGKDKTFHLRARVAGQFDRGIGREFFKPDQEAIRALQTLADRQHEQSAKTTLPTEASPSNAEALLANCKQGLDNYLAPKLELLFEHAEEALLESARNATSNAKYNLYFDARKELTCFEEPIQSAFFDVIISQMNHLGSTMAAVEEPEEVPSSDDLSLVESGQFADWLTAKEIYARAEPGIREELYKLEQRLGNLSGVIIEEDNNPLGLAILCQTFHDALQTAHSTRLARQVMFGSFDDLVIKNLNSFYEELNAFLEQSGVLVDLETPRPVVPKIPESVDDTQTASPAPYAAPIDGGAGRLVGNPIPASTQLSSGVNQGMTYRTSEYLATPTGSALQSDAASLPDRPSDRRFPAIAPVPSSPTSGAQNTHRGVSIEGQVHVTTKPSSAPEQSLGRDGAVANDMAPHPSVANGIPFNTQHVPVGDVYSSPTDITHSAYEPAQALLSLSGQMPPINRDGDPPPTYKPEQVMGALSLLQELEASQPASGTDISDLKTRVMGALRSRHGHAEKKDTPAQEQTAIAFVGELVKSIVSDALVTSALKPKIRRLELPLLNIAMRDPDFFASRNHPARQVVNRFSQIAGTKHGLLDDDITNSVDGIMERIVNYSARDADVFAEAVRKLDSVLAQQAAIRQANISNVVNACEEQQALVRSRAGRELSKVNERELPKEWRQWLSRAKRLQVGDAVMLDKNTDNPQHGALAWVGENHATYVFVDTQGLKTSTLSLNELAMQLRRSEAGVIPEANLPAMDRGLYAMLKNMHEAVLKQANRDELTELLNQREFDNRVNTTTAEAKRNNSRHALCLMDLVHFHIINDTCGRKAGDRLLQEVGKILQKNMGHIGELARLGEDKFGALLKNVSEDRAFEIAEKQRAAIEKFRVTWKGERLQLTVSIGLIQISAENEGSRTLQEAAALARERAKAAGGNRIDVYRVDEATTQADEAGWVPRIEQALEKSQLVLRCQKFSSLDDNSPDKPHYEILLGVLDEKSEMTLPGEFIQAAEIYEKIIEVDRWVIANAFSWMSDNKRKLALMGGVSIKLSEKSLSDENTLAYVLDQFFKSKLPPRKVVFEITENPTLTSLSNAENFIRVLGEYGCRFLLDDFGNGQSSYAYLKHLPFDFVKIDGMFVRNIADNPGDLAMVKSINEIGHFMGKKTIAEFVENDAILKTLRDIGIDYAQGFAVEKPIRLIDLT